MKEKLLTIILFLLLTIRVGIENDIVIPNNSLPYNIFKTVELPYAAILQLRYSKIQKV